MMAIPFAYALPDRGVTAGLLGSAVVGFGLTMIWAILACYSLDRRLMLQRGFTKCAEDQRSELENTYNEVMAELAASRQMNDDFLKEISTLSGQVADGRTKDALIEALKRRAANVSAEYNDKRLPGHRGTTLGDVYKLTGEAEC